MSANIQTLTDWRAFYELTKPRVVALIVFTAVVGMFLAVPGWPGAIPLIFGTIGIGFAAAGAAPPLLGWAAVTGEVNSGALLLFLIIFVWTPPHFWALAIARKEEYAKVDIPMLPVTHGEDYTRLTILLYTILLILVTTLPYVIGMSGLIYLGTALVLGTMFTFYAVQMMRYPEELDRAMETFRFSINYLGLLFGALLLDHYFLFQPGV